jgi:hypothetical protein
VNAISGRYRSLVVAAPNCLTGISVSGTKTRHEQNHVVVGPSDYLSPEQRPHKTQESGNMWLHLPEMSINLAQVLRIIPSADGKIAIVQPDNITVTVDGVNAAAVCQILSTQPAGHLDSWLAQKLQVMRAAAEAAAPPAAPAT